MFIHGAKITELASKVNVSSFRILWNKKNVYVRATI
jgi:hypothetical protein